MFGFDFSLLKEAGVGVPDFIAIMNGDFQKASKLGTTLLTKYQPNMVEGINGLSKKYEEKNITLMVSVQYQEDLNKILTPFICIDVCSINESSEVSILESLPLTQLPEFLSVQYNNPSNDDESRTNA